MSHKPGYWLRDILLFFLRRQCAERCLYDSGNDLPLSSLCARELLILQFQQDFEWNMQDAKNWFYHPITPFSFLITGIEDAFIILIM